ncbi:MAG: bifunctional demethylmenaquinone methyltransferase/2-methoxy-6-polyprenyl-1,4-benzoquinol methylase UbiE [Alphaproteobacteria bacterium]
MINQEKNWFGNRNVSPDEKTGLVIDVFDSVASRYDLMNDLMSGGMHRLWKDRFVRMIRPRGGLSYLDVAGGTGDIAFRIRRSAGSGAAITVCDLNDHMLSVGRDRAIDKGWLQDFEWVTGNAESLPFPDSSFDVYTIAFGLRNVTHIDTALKDAYRILKPGGRFYCLEFSHVESALLGKAYDLYSHAVIPKIGEFVTKDAESYRYLVESIRKFPTQKKLAGRLGQAGFTKVRPTNFSAGIVCAHESLKL